MSANAGSNFSREFFYLGGGGGGFSQVVPDAHFFFGFCRYFRNDRFYPSLGYAFCGSFFNDTPEAFFSFIDILWISKLREFVLCEICEGLPISLLEIHKGLSVTVEEVDVHGAGDDDGKMVGAHLGHCFPVSVGEEGEAGQSDIR